MRTSGQNAGILGVLALKGLALRQCQVKLPFEPLWGGFRVAPRGDQPGCGKIHTALGVVAGDPGGPGRSGRADHYERAGAPQALPDGFAEVRCAGRFLVAFRRLRALVVSKYG